ncbi:MAG: sulfatase [Nanohaloarchaea archaeon SW_4_43_9]|nr:MAG: sulfatase [Nanohaloarchaea archaeon SW_4_43_9]
MNILFICIDCLRDDHVNTEHADTPFLDRLSEEGKHFRNMYSTTTTTTPSIASLMTGLYSERNGINSLREAELREDISTLAEKFSENGYSTHAEVSGPLVDKTELDRGFNTYNYRNSGEDLFSGWKDNLESELENIEEPFFFFLHLWEMHTPVEVPEEFDSPEYGKTPYARTLSALDRELEEVVDDVSDDTLIVLHGDHGESISWRTSFIQNNLKKGRTLFRHLHGVDTRKAEGILNRAVENLSSTRYKDHFLEAGHGENIYDFTTNVPFIIKGTDIESGENSKQVRQIDIFPTLLDIADIDYSNRINGETLLQKQLENRKVYMRACGTSLQSKKNWSRGVRVNSWKYIEYPHRDWEPELYNLEKDPNELRNIDNKEKLEELEQELPDKKLLESKEMEIKDKLEELGYV